ncbi:hypothetical protein EVAR_28903_1 [Eumeta japonica]|uniref:Uncharacterized protein n=1 Tax=Eumeta variegata TaxID=151549 RepID=A0A4C1WZI3_EUMVA|nr:hypothetical protein EVAR_28903_1 [Eumeta japonica]
MRAPKRAHPVFRGSYAAQAGKSAARPRVVNNRIHGFRGLDILLYPFVTGPDAWAHVRVCVIRLSIS